MDERSHSGHNKGPLHMLTLYYSPGGVAFAAHMVLEELGLPYALERILTGEEQQHSPAFLQINPLARVPVLKLDDGRLLTESAAVLQYLAALHPQGGAALVPSDPWLRARCQEWLSLIGTTLHPTYAMVIRPDRTVADETTHAALRAASHARFVATLKHCETRVPEEGWLLGSEFSVADAYLTVIVMWTRFIRLPLDEMPKLKAWYGRVTQRPTFTRTLRAEGLIDADGKPTPPTRV